MKRDWDLIRRILCDLERLESVEATLQPGSLTGYDPELVSYHVDLLMQSGLVTGRRIAPLGVPAICLAQSLTWDGHELLDRMRDQSMWNRICGDARKKGLDLSFDVIKALAAAALKSVAGIG